MPWVKGSVHPSGSGFSPEDDGAAGENGGSGRGWWLQKAVGRCKDFLPMRCSTGTGQGLAAASAPSSP